jgi:HlyD family secretion protein
MTHAEDAQDYARPRRRPWLWGGVLLAALVAAWFLFGRGKDDAEPYRTAAVDRGEIVRAVSATGQLQPLVSVDVGSTVSGPIKSVEVDFNAPVKKGQVLARIDPETFLQRVRQAEASLAQARAEANAARADYGRYERLAKEGFASDQLLLQNRTAAERANASVALAQAQLAAARIDLDRTVIRSPVDGVVVDRQVDPGQTVAASFQAATLFVIAQDLSQLEAAITVDEADIGEVQEGMPVRFTVDAFSDENFEGRVTQVRKQGVQTSGVVSYTVIVRADNPRGRLLPGMTANAEIVIEEKPDVLRVANSALRFSPADPQLAAKAKALGGRNGARSGEAAAASGGARQGGQQGGQRGGQMLERLAEQLDLTPAQKEQARAAMQAARASAGAFPGPEATQAERRAFMRKAREASMRALEPILTPAQKEKLAALRAAGAGREQRTRQAVLWVLRDNRPEPVQVELGVAADAFTEVVSGLAEGDLVITGGGPQSKEKNQQSPMGPGGGVRIRGG